MAYGHSDKTALKRMIPLGMGSLTDSKYQALSEFRKKYIETCTHFASLVFSLEPIAYNPSRNEIETILCNAQKQVKGFNKAYAEKARLAVSSNIYELHKRYLIKLVGRLRHAGQMIEDPKPDSSGVVRRFYYVPVDIQDSITKEELTDLQDKSKSWNNALSILKSVIIDGNTSGLTGNQVKVVHEIYSQVHSRHRPPEYGTDPRYTCQIHLDYRVIRDKDKTLSSLNSGIVRFLIDGSNTRYWCFLEIANPEPRKDPIRIPLTLNRKHLNRLENKGEVKSLVIELARETISIKAVLASAPEVPILIKDKYEPEDYEVIASILNSRDSITARDFGYANTISLTTVTRDRDITHEELEAVLSLDKEKAREYLSSLHHPCDNVIEERIYSGRKFLDLIAKHSRRIDNLKSEIDLIYNKIGRYKEILVSYLCLYRSEMIPRDETPDNPYIRKVHKKFFDLLDHVTRLRKIRYSLYQKIAGIKKTWFGYLSTRERLMAERHNSSIIREDLTVMAVEKEKPEYKGRTFNKMINNGSKGQYIRMASDKLSWNGVPELALPSFYTSSACCIHSIVDKKMRKGEAFQCPQCAERRHADGNASVTLANYLLLRSQSPAGVTNAFQGL